jgi:hypothetical protein
VCFSLVFKGYFRLALVFSLRLRMGKDSCLRNTDDANSLVVLSRLALFAQVQGSIRKK